MNKSNSSPAVGMGAIAVILAWLLGAALVATAIVLAVVAVIALVGWLFEDGAEFTVAAMASRALAAASSSVRPNVHTSDRPSTSTSQASSSGFRR